MGLTLNGVWTLVLLKKHSWRTTLLASVFIVNFPKAIKAFYMKRHATRDDVVVSADLLAPEGYGEIIGGS